MTLTDRLPRATYLLDDGPDRPAVICLSYTWCDDSLKWLPLSANERMEVMLKSLSEIYPKVDIRKHIIGNPVTVSWENEPYFMGAFKANLPGHYRYQRRLFTRLAKAYAQAYAHERLLVQFDGVTFRVFDRQSTPTLKDPDVTALFEDANEIAKVGVFHQASR